MRVPTASALVLTLGLIMALPGMATAASIVINNGLAPPNPANVIDDGTHSGDVHVRNAGCPAGWPAVGNPWDLCPSPGGPTAVEVADGGEVGGYLSVHESSTVTMNGGMVGAALYALDSSTITMNGGTVLENLEGLGSTITMNGGTVIGNLYGFRASTVTMNGGTVMGELFAGAMMMSGGTVGGHLTIGGPAVISGGWFGGDLFAQASSTIAFAGTNFAVNGLPVPYGDLTALIGNLTGTLASGESLDTVFYQGGGYYQGEAYTGTITLIPEPGTALLLGCGLVGMAMKRRRAARVASATCGRRCQ